MSTETELVFNHLIELPYVGCIFCSTREPETGKVRLFLIFRERRRVYIRNGIKETWEELTDQRLYDFVMQTFNKVILERKVPCFTALTSL